MKISKQYLKQLIMEELEESLEIPGGPHGYYDKDKNEYSPGHGPDPEKNLSDMLISLTTAIKMGDKEEAMKLVNAVRAMTIQFSKDKYTGTPSYPADYPEQVRTGKAGK